MTDETDASGAVAPADDAAADRARRALAAVWRIESARIVATLTRFVGDVGQAEDLAQEAMLEALRQWPEEGVPNNPGAWLTTVAKRRAIDGWRRRERLDERYAAMARDLEQQGGEASGAFFDPDTIDDDVLRLVFVACHPVLSREAQVALTLRIVGGLSSEDIARAFLVPVATVQQRIVRAKKTLTAAKVPFEVPDPEHYAERLGSVQSVLYLIFNEGYLPASGTEWVRPDVSAEALRLARMVAELMPREPEAHALVALMEFHASRFAARTARDGTPIPLDRQDRSRWDRAQIERGRDGTRACRPHRPRPRLVWTAGRDRRVPRRRADGRGHRLGSNRAALRGARPHRPVARRRAQPRRRRGDGHRSCERAAPRRRTRALGQARGLPGAAGRAR